MSTKYWILVLCQPDSVYTYSYLQFVNLEMFHLKNHRDWPLRKRWFLNWPSSWCSNHFHGPYHTTPAKFKELAIWLKQLFQKEFIRPRVSPWGAIALLIEKKNRSSGSCIDFRELSKIIIENKYPFIPNAWFILSTVNRNKLFQDWLKFRYYCLKV